MGKFYKPALVLLMVFTTTTVLWADVFDDLAGAIRSGSANQVARYFDNNVEMTTGDKSNVYSRNQAEIVLNDFFNKISPRSFNIIHRGSSAKGALYAIGSLESAQGNYRVYLYVKENGGTPSIQEIRFEKE